MTTFWLRLLSYLWPIRVWRGTGAHGELEMVWEYGRLVVNSANANQSFGSSHRVWQRAFRDAGIKDRRPRNALVLGYGAGSVTHILRTELGLDLRITGVDDDATMLRLARERAEPDRDGMKDLMLVEQDAMSFAAGNHGNYDLIVVDLFNDLDFAGGVEERPFLQALQRLASDRGPILINTVAHDARTAARSARLGEELRLLFTEVREQRYEGNNRVFIAL